jgi:hypothetical protein
MACPAGRPGTTGSGTVFTHVSPPSAERSMAVELTTRHRLSGFEAEIDSLVARDSLSIDRRAAAVPANESDATPGDPIGAGGAGGGSGGAEGAARLAGGSIAWFARGAGDSCRSCSSAFAGGSALWVPGGTERSA